MPRRSVGQKLAQRVLSSGKSVSGLFFRAVFEQFPGEESRSSVIVSKKVAKTAPARNRIKRRARAILAGCLPELTPGSTVLLFARPNARTATHEDLKKDVTSLVHLIIGKHTK